MQSASNYVRLRNCFLNGEVVEMEDSAYRLLQSQMFMSIWNERRHRCNVSDVALTMDARTYYFHHILEKRAFEKYALCKWNIVLLDYDVHNAYEVKADTVPQLVLLRNQLIHFLDSGYEYDNDFIWAAGSESPDYIHALMGNRITQQP